MFGWILLLILDFLIFCFYSFKHSFIFFLLISLIFIWQSKFFRGVTFNLYLLKNSDIFYIDYLGDYYQISKEFEKLAVLLKKFNLSRSCYNIFAVYYENPQKADPKTFRAIIGIMKEIKKDNDITNHTNNGSTTNNNKLTSKEEEFMDYLVKNKFRKAVIPETESVFSYFPFSNEMSQTIGIKKFYSTLDSSLQDEEFKRKFNIDKKKFKIIFEVYKNDTIFFYIPLRNYERFNLLTKEKGNENRKSL